VRLLSLLDLETLGPLPLAPTTGTVLEVAWDAHPGRSLRHLLPPSNHSSGKAVRHPMMIMCTDFNARRAQRPCQWVRAHDA